MNEIVPAIESTHDEETGDRILFQSVIAVVLTGAIAVARQRWWV